MGNEAAANVPPDSDRATRFLTGLRELLKTPTLPTLPATIASSARLCAQCDNTAVFLESGTSYRCVVVSDHAGVHTVDDGLVLSEQWPPIHAMRTGISSHLIPETRTDPAWTEQAPGSPGSERVHTWLALALQVGDRLLGFIGLSFQQFTVISDSDRRSLEQFASAAASLLQQAMLLAEAASDAAVRNAQLDSAVGGLWAALEVVQEALKDGSDIRTAVGAIGKAVPAVLPNDALLIVTMPDGSRPLERLYSDYPDGNDALDDVANTIAPLLSGRTAPLALNSFDPYESPEAHEALRAAGLQASLAVPVLGEAGEGVVLLLGRRQGLFSEGEAALAERFATVLGATLRREEIVRDARAAAVRDERDRLAREIHDVLAQTITGLVMQLDALAGAVQPDSPLFDRLVQTRNMGRAAAAETRRLVWNLRPASVDLSKPRVVVQEEAGRFERRANLTPHVDVVGEDRPISSEIGAVIQRLMQVALENVTRHSEATQVHILLHFGLHGLSLQIEDDGEGFDPESINKSAGRLGLASVTERARQVGGSLRIESAAGHGTRVQLELPFNPAPPIPRARVSEPPPSHETREEVGAAGSIRIVLIDDHAMVREGLTRMLSEQADFRVLEAVSTGTDGLRAIADLRPDVVLCDLQLPDIPGTEVIARARAHFPDIRCLVVTTFDDDENIYEAIKAGAKGYVLKDASAEDLVDAVRAVARNESLLQPVVAHKLVQRLGALARQGDMVETLTEREVEVLRALAGGLRNKEIAFQLGLSESTIKTHLASIFGKLGVTTRTEAVSRGRELGLIPL
jgi:DNA-binding NarL/FixJ family response regulator/signal transduction histidine kinase